MAMLKQFLFWLLLGAAFTAWLLVLGLRFANAASCSTIGGPDSWTTYTTCSDGSSAFTLQGKYSSYTTITPGHRRFYEPPYREGPAYYDEEE